MIRIITDSGSDIERNEYFRKCKRKKICKERKESFAINF